MVYHGSQWTETRHGCRRGSGEAPSAISFTWGGLGEERTAVRQDAPAKKTTPDSEPAAAVGDTLTLVRWFTIAALFLIALAQPVLSRTGLPTWILILLFACYSGATALLRQVDP